jgi:diaminopimelate epimerase
VQAFRPSERQRRLIADRHLGVGCDQLIVIEPPSNGRADAFMRIFNPDGSEGEACGNATRCVAALLMAEGARERVSIETLAGLLPAERIAGGGVTVDMGPAYLAWDEIPVAGPCDTLELDLALGPLSRPTAVGLGNPHAVFFVDDTAAIPLAELGPALERHAMFPRRANIGVAHLAGPDRLRLRVWERGVGLTLACGSGACAAAVAAHRRGLTGRRVEVVLDGGPLAIEWRADGHVTMAGPFATSFTGTLAGALANGAA